MDEKCVRCETKVEGNRTILQCWRADTPTDELAKNAIETYCEMFVACKECANEFEASKKVVVIHHCGHPYLVDRMLDIKSPIERKGATDEND